MKSERVDYYWRVAYPVDRQNTLMLFIRMRDIFITSSTNLFYHSRHPLRAYTRLSTASQTPLTLSGSIRSEVFARSLSFSYGVSYGGCTNVSSV